MIKKIAIAIAVIIPLALMSQEKKGAEPSRRGDASLEIMPQAQYSNKFAIKGMNFNKKIDLGGKGDVLEVEFILYNLIDDDQELYIFTIATFEKTEKTKRSFEEMVPEKERIKNFVPFPYDLANFQYPEKDKEGNPVKDESGHEKVKLLKAPKDAKKGVGPSGEAYKLKNRLVVRTLHLSPYKNNYVYFNEVAVIIFDKEGKPIFRQLYNLEGKRR